MIILPFESFHFRPNGGSGVLEYGYRIETKGIPSMVFPGDIRDFEIDKSRIPSGDIVFAHLWLGDDSITEGSWKSHLESWAKFMLKFQPKTVFITHIYENGRPDDRMWRMEHASKAEETIKLMNDKINVIIPDWGNSYKL